ncbi:MAG: DUF4383 domain-containing protein [Rhodospirillales bacterium]|nr:DUF4383 domain-containing protein [Rhodospirillales bacterium]
MGTRYFSLIVGLLFLLAGLLGFVPGFVAAPMGAPPLVVDSGYGLLFGLFPINVLHNIVHLLIGVWGIVAWRRFASARTFSKSLAVIYGVLAVMGLIPILNVTFGYIPLFGHDIWLHALTAIAAAYFGFAPVRAPTEPALR